MLRHLIERIAVASALASIAVSLVATPARASLDRSLDAPGDEPTCATSEAATLDAGDTVASANKDNGVGDEPAGGPVHPAPPATQVPPGFGMYGSDWPVVSDTTVTYTEGRFTHTVRTTVQRGTRPGMTAGSLSPAGRMAAPLAGTCSYTGTVINTQQDTVCGAGCMDEYMRRTYDTYTQGTSNNYYGRREVRLWWTREYSAGIDFNGAAYTQWNENYAWDCNGANQGRQVGAYTSPVWYAWDRTYDYYWDETYLPIVTPTPLGTTLFVYTDAPTTYGYTLHTQIALP